MSEIDLQGGYASCPNLGDEATPEERVLVELWEAGLYDAVTGEATEQTMGGLPLIDPDTGLPLV